MLDSVPGLPGHALLLAPTAPMPASDGAAWMWAERQDDGFAWALESAGHGLATFAREVRRCNPGRRVVLVGHGQGAHVGPAAAALNPSIADELFVVGGLSSSWVPAALPATVMLGAQARDVELARAQTQSWAGGPGRRPRDRPCRTSRATGRGDRRRYRHRGHPGTGVELAGGRTGADLAVGSDGVPADGGEASLSPRGRVTEFWEIMAAYSLPMSSRTAPHYAR